MPIGWTQAFQPISRMLAPGRFKTAIEKFEMNYFCNEIAMFHGQLCAIIKLQLYEYMILLFARFNRVKMNKDSQL